MATFDYFDNIPAAPNNPSADQPLMLTNTQSIDSIIAVDHYSFESATSIDGTHKQVTLTNESGPGIPAGTNAVFHANNYLGNSWPYWQNALGDFLILSGDTLAAANGYSFISQGILLQWGTGTIAAQGTSTSFSFTKVFPNNVFAIVLGFINNQGNSPSANSAFIKSGTQTTSGFTVTNSSSSSTQAIYYIAIGN